MDRNPGIWIVKPAAPKMRRARFLGVSAVAILFLAASIAGFSISIGWMNGAFSPLADIWRNWTFPPVESAKGFEADSFARLKYREPNLEFRPHPDFRNFLRDALAFGQISLVRELPHEIKPVSYSNTSFEGNQILSRYNKPPLKLRSIWAGAGKDRPELLVILPNWRSSAAKVMGFDNADFHLQLGNAAKKWGFDVGVIETVSDAGIAAAINVRLTMIGLQLMGLQAHHVCSVVAWQARRNSYRRVILYGFGMGARLADIVSVVCPEVFNLVVLDGQPTPWKRHIWRQAAAGALKEPAIFQYELPLISETSFLDFMGDEAVKKIYLLGASDIDQIQEPLKRYYDLQPASMQENGAILAERQAKDGLPDIRCLRTIMQEGAPGASSVQLFRLVR